MEDAASRLRVKVFEVLEALILTAVAGGSGSGRRPPMAEGVWMLVRRLAGEFAIEVVCACAVLEAGGCWVRVREAGLKALATGLAPVMNSW